MKVRDIMVPIQKCLKPDNTLKDAVNILRTTPCDSEQRLGVNGLPVVNQEGKVIGILSMLDILKAVHPFYLSMTDLSKFTWEGMVRSMVKGAGDKAVAAFMTRDVATVHEKDSMMECVDLMIRKTANQLPVLDDMGKVVGMIYERDVFCAIADVMIKNDKSEVVL